MMPNIDPRALKGMMDRMGIKSEEISAKRVIIEGEDVDIIIENPQVVKIEMQGALSFQVAGNVTEKSKAKIEITDDDIKFVSEQTGISDMNLIRSTLEEVNGNIAEAIAKLNAKG
ncbi:MAG: nascent polypeptide-associated complex protein [Candidatus Micrarchaeia archaeon]